MFDIIIIGGGPGGYAAAEYAAEKGLSVALVERSRLGGTCLHHGCIPTKEYLHASQVASEAETIMPGAIAAFNWQAMYAHKNTLLDTLTGGIATLMKARRVTVVQGTGTLMNAASPFTVKVSSPDGENSILEGKHILLATGSAPARIPVPGCDSPGVWTSDDLLGEAGAKPIGSLLIVGGGVIGVEMASIYTKLGTAVTVLEAEKRCLPMMDAELSRSAEALLKSTGVTVLTDARLTEVAATASGFAIRYEKGGKATEVNTDHVLLATGRVPVTEALFAPDVTPRYEPPRHRCRCALCHQHRRRICHWGCKWAYAAGSRCSRTGFGCCKPHIGHSRAHQYRFGTRLCLYRSGNRFHRPYTGRSQNAGDCCGHGESADHTERENPD